MAQVLTSMTTDQAPVPIGPYSQVVVLNNLAFCSGQIPVDPVSGHVVSEDIIQQTQQVLNNLEAVLHAARSRLSLVAKITIYLADLSDFADVNRLYADRFAPHKPARTTVEVSRLPLGVRIELDCIAAVDY